MNDRRCLPAIALVGGLTLAGLWTVFQLRPLPVHPDEFLPLFSRAYLRQPAAARSAIPADWAVSCAGLEFPRYCYAHIGPLKGLLWAAWPGRMTVTAHRLGNLLLLGGLLLLLIRLAGPEPWARWLAAGLLLGDLSLLILGITDEGPILLLLLGATAMLLLLRPDRPPRRWEPPALAVLAFLGCWDRLNFAWFLAAGLGAAGAAVLIERRPGALRTLATRTAGLLVGAVGAALWLPDSAAKLIRGTGAGLPWAELPARWWDLSALATPFGAFHRYVDTSAPPCPGLDGAYRWLLTAALAVAAVAAAVTARRLGRDRKTAGARRLFLLLVPLLLGLAIVKTRQTWSSHHVILLKPYLYLGMASLTAPAARWPVRRRRWALAALCLAVAGQLGLSAAGYRDCLGAPPRVSWNALDAVQATEDAPLERIHVLDWGAYWPGVVLSRPEQRWERERRVRSMDELQRRSLRRGGGSFGVVFRTGGRGDWLLRAAAEPGSPVRSIRTFDNHPGPPWHLAEIAPAAPAGDPRRPPRNPAVPGTDESRWIQGVEKGRGSEGPPYPHSSSRSHSSYSRSTSASISAFR